MLRGHALDSARRWVRPGTPQSPLRPDERDQRRREAVYSPLHSLGDCLVLMFTYHRGQSGHRSAVTMCHQWEKASLAAVRAWAGRWP